MSAAADPGAVELSALEAIADAASELARREGPARTIDRPLPPHLAAKELGVTVQYVRVLCRTNKLRAFRVGRHWKIRRADLDAYISNHSNAA